MNTTDLIIQLADKLSISQKQARRLLYQEMDAIAEQLSEGKHVIIRGFGTFGLRDSRTTKQQAVATKNIFFRASQKFKDFVKPWRPS